MNDPFQNMADLIGQHRRAYLRGLALLCLGSALVFIGLHFAVWHTYYSGIACVIYAPVCLFVIWGSYQHERPLELFANLMVLATMLLTLAVTAFQRADIVVDHWILAAPALGFVLCKRQVAIFVTVLALLGYLGIRLLAQYPTPLWSSVSLAVMIVSISFGLYMYSLHIGNIESFILQLGNTDSLTGTLNRHSLRQVLQTEFRRNLRHQVSMTVFMIDADHFKAYNDRYGHVSGDHALASIAETLKQSARRPGDFVFRYGGEEFCILCSGLDAAQAAALAESLRANVEALQLEHQAAPTGRVTVSVGYRHAEPWLLSAPERLIDEADKALYCAKGKGRNRVEQYLSAAVA